MLKPPRVFLSYSHDGEAHARRVLDLADQLRRHGVNVLLDQYVPAPVNGWTPWMRECLDPANSDFVLLICTEGYLRRVEGREAPGEGLGARWEGKLMYSALYGRSPEELKTGGVERYIPILLGGAGRQCIPAPLFDFTRYEIQAFTFQDPGYEGLYRHLTGQPPTPPGEVGQLVVLSPRRSLCGAAEGQAGAGPGEVDGPGAGPVAVVGAAATGAAVLAAALPVTAPKVLQFRLRGSDTAPSGYTVAFAAPGAGPVELAFACDPWSEKQTREALEKIEKGACLRDDLAYAGSQLWSGMVHGAIQGGFEAARGGSPGAFFHARLRLPRKLDDLPWEALYETRAGFLGTSERYCVIRDVPEDLPPPPPRPADRAKVGLLVVMPEGSGLDLATEKARLQQRAGVQGEAVVVKVLEGRVTPDALRQAIEEGGWDVVHFAGHARTNDGGEVMIRLNSPDDPAADFWMEAEVFSSLFNRGGVRLVVFNCCRGASPYSAGSTRGLSGLGPFLLRKGVPAVIAMRYDLPDPTALRFADEFYRVLFAGAEPGRVDLALEKARVVIYQNQTDRTVRDFVTPVLYLASGHERAFALAPPALPSVTPVGSTPPGPRLEIPEDLLVALKEDRCVPVVGPGLLMADALRDEVLALGPLDLARRLAKESNYRTGELFELATKAGPWLDAMLLQWVCEHFHGQRRIRFKLYNAIQQTFRTQKPSAALRAIAAWNAPGYVCTYFDGLLQQALQDRSRPLQVLNSLRTDVAVEAGSALLVHLRGNWSDPGSLVLTEEQHNALLDCLVQVPTRVASLARGSVGRSLLFLGVDPRDPLVRRLVSKLIPEEHRETVGPVYFACADPTDDDKAYWEDFETVWLNDPLVDLVMALTAELHMEVSR